MSASPFEEVKSEGEAPGIGVWIRVGNGRDPCEVGKADGDGNGALKVRRAAQGRGAGCWVKMPSQSTPLRGLRGSRDASRIARSERPLRIRRDRSLLCSVPRRVGAECREAEHRTTYA